MPAEIRNSTFPTTVVDLLLPPASAASRSGSDEAFDSLLRTLAAPETTAPREASSSGPSGRPQSASSERRSDRAEYSSPPAPNDRPPIGQQRDDADSDASQSEPVAAQHGQPSGGQAEESAEADEQAVEQAQPATGDQAEEPKAVDESDQGDAAKAEADEVEDIDAIDPIALQMAAAAAQATAAKSERQPVSSAVDEAKSSQEQQPLADAGKEAERASTPVVASALAETAEAEPVAAPVTKIETKADGQIEAALPETLMQQAAETPAAEDGLVDATLLAADEAEAESDEVVAISEVKSTRTGARQAMFHETPPQQDEAAAVSGEATDPTSEAAGETAEAPSNSEPTASLSAVEALSDSPSRDEGKRSSAESKGLDATEAVAEPAAAESPAMETALAEAPPAESGIRSPAESTRSEQRPQQLPPTLVDANQRPAGAPRLAAEVLAGGSREASHSRPIEIDSARFLTRVAKAFTAAQQRGGEVQLRLSPPELGSLRVEVKVLDGVMTARVETENAAAKSAVLEHLPQLRERLAEQGVRIERFDVDLMQNGSSGTPDRPADRQPDETFPRRQAARSASSESRTTSAPRAASATLSAGGGLNVIV